MLFPVGFWSVYTNQPDFDFNATALSLYSVAIVDRGDFELASKGKRGED